MIANDRINFTEHAGGVFTIDSGFVRENMTACYFVEAGSEAAFIEVGSNSSTPRLMRVLEMRGWKPEEVRYVIVTHVHLDHAGGAGSLMQLLPNATLLVHPYGARHMIDPAKLEVGSRAVYGDRKFEQMYGTLIPVAEDRMQIMEDGDKATLGNRELRFMDTPGHARHHFCVHDSHTNGWFTGDTFGMSYREFDTQNGAFLLPTTTPIQFDPEPLKESVRKLVANDPDCMYLTHFGKVENVQKLAATMIEGVDMFVEFAEQYKNHDQRQQQIESAMADWLLSGLRAHGVSLTEDQCLQILESDIKLNTQGIEVWLDHRKR